MKLTDKEFQQLADYLYATAGIHLTLQKKNLMLTRLAAILERKGFTSFQQYYEYLKGDTSGAELSDFINRISTNHTYFYREEEHFTFLKDHVFKELLQKERLGRDIRIWSAGCSNGAEPYTIAMLLQDFFGEDQIGWDKKILATDISAKVLEQAVQGIYPERDLDRMPNLWKMKYFQKVNLDQFQIVKPLRDEVIYRRLNLLSPFPFKKKFHVIFCRNVMIYFDDPTKNEILNKFYQALEPGGYLFIGHSETIDRGAVDFKYVMPSVYKRDE